MRNYIYLLVLLLLATACKSQEKKNEWHPIVLKAKETSLYTKQLDWEKINTEFKKLTAGKEQTADIKEGLQYLINSLGDKHARFLSAKDYSIVVNYKGAIAEDNEGPKPKGAFINSVINDVSARFTYQLLEDDIGYLKIVGIGPGDVKEQSDFIRNGLLDLKKQGANKWIVDLRFNGGGNIEPMLSGLAPLLGEGFVGGGINSADEVRTFRIEKGQFYNYDRLACAMNELPKIAASEKIAVLLSRYTISSGEMLAISFKGREQTTFIGEPTAGYTTGTGFDIVNEELALVIAQDVFIDRNKKKYHGKVGVDTYMEFQHLVAIEEDKQIDKAMVWLNQ